MKTIVGFALAISFFLAATPANAIDDGPRAYWKARDGANIVSTQYLSLDMQSSNSKMFDASAFIFPNADAEANIFLGSYARHFTLFDSRPSSISLNVMGGSADVDVNTTIVDSHFLPLGVARGATLRQSTSGWGDPSTWPR